MTEPARMVDGARMIVRGVQRLVGVSLGVAAFGLWYAPGASWDSDVLLFKLILSIVAVLACAGLINASVRPRAPEVEIDTVRREVRLIRRTRGAATEILQRCSFRDLSCAEYQGSIVRFWDKSGTFMAEITVPDRSALKSLLAGLRDAGKIV